MGDLRRAGDRRATRWLGLGLASVVGAATVAVGVAAPVQARPTVPPPEVPGREATKIDRLDAATDGHVRIAKERGTTRVRFVGTTKGDPIPRARGVSASASPVAQARGFLDSYGSLFGVDDQASQLDASARGDVVDLQQVHDGVPVMGGELKVNLTDDGDVVSANGEISPDLTVDTEPEVTSTSATATAKQLTKRTHGASGALEGEAALWVYDPALLGSPDVGAPRLVWRVELGSDDGEPFRDLVLVDATTGGIALHIEELEHAKNRQVCNRNNVVGGAENCTGGYVRTEGQAATGVGDVDKAYDFAGDTYDFYFSKFGRDSLDNAGLTLKSTVKFCPDASHCPYANAFWNGTGMVYGDGYASADDVVGHELSHGVTEFESHLFYYYQSGAINESFSDVFGELIDQGNGVGTDTAATKWLMGEDLSIGAIRDMESPPAYGDPDRMGSASYWTASTDNGGVHTNSGINNKAAFLIADGGTFNGQTITGLGNDKMARIYYKTQTDLLTSAADYNDLYDALQQGCQALVGTNGITVGDCGEVTKAVQATEMNLQPPAAASATEAPVCGAGLVPNDLFNDNLENTGSGNWGFTTISGSQAWAYPQNPNIFSGFDATYATSGTKNMFGGNRSTTSNTAIARTGDVVPPVGKTTYLRFRHAYGLDNGFDGGRVEYSTNGGGSWTDAGSKFTDNGYNANVSALGGTGFTGESHGYYSSRIDLSSLAGQNVRYRFRLQTGSSINVLGWFIDDVRVYTCDPAATAPGAPTIGTATAGNAQATVTWTAPASDGGSAITGYSVTPFIGAAAQTPQVFNSTATTQNVTGLGNGTTYTFKVAAINAIGTGSPSAESNAVTPSGSTAPGAPIIGNALPGNGSVALTWLAPGSNGGSSITEYVITPYIDAVAQPAVPTGSTATSKTVTGLANGTTYTFTVAAKNAIGTGAPSAQSGTVTAGAPASPGFPAAAPGDASAKVAYTAPANNGSPVTGYQVTPYIGAVAQAPQTFMTTATSNIVTGLANGTTYTFKLAAINANGTGPQSTTPAVTVGTPNAPGFPNANPQTTSARLSWLVSSPNGSPLLGYKVTPYIGSVAQPTQTFNSTTNVQVISGLTSGTNYSFRVAGFNSIGTGPEAQSGVVTVGSPGAVGFQSAVPGNGGAIVQYLLPPANGAPIESFTVWPVQGVTVLSPQVFNTPSATKLTVTGLTNGVTYTFRVAATNSIGTSPPTPTNAITAGTPNAPGYAQAQPGNGTAKVAWFAPADNGSPITSYAITPYIGTAAQPTQTFASSATSQIVTGLTNGTTYTFKVVATNGVGPGLVGATNLSVKVGTPTSPNFPSAKPGNASAIVAWGAPTPNAGAVTGYVVTPVIGTTALAPQTFNSTATTQTITGLTNGTTYTFRVAAINALGTGPYGVTAAVKVGTPSAPAKPTVVAGVGEVTVTWVAPAANGSAITGYVVTPIKAGVAQAPQAFDASTTSRTITGLIPGSSYTFTVVAVNAVGSSAASPASNAAIPT